jgi:putative component of membrane protein insertase Oxa1/YidC/SpoIIIJ protein YidD
MNLKNIPAQLSIVLIETFRYILGPAQKICPFTVGCTQYAIQQLQNKSFFMAWKNIIDRLILCNPIHNYVKKK